MRWLLLFVASFLLFQTSSYAYPVGEVDFQAASLTGEEVSLWLQKLPNIPKTIGLFSIKTQPPLDPAFANVIEVEISKNVQSQNITKLSICSECRTPKIQVRGDHVAIVQGAPDLKTLQDLGKKLDVEAFLVLDVYRTKLSLISQANLYNSESGQIISSETFKIPTLDIANSAMQLMLKGGPGFKIVKKSSSPGSSNSTLPLAANIVILEELGSGKGGLNIGGVFSKDNAFGYVMPTLAWRGKFEGSSLYSLKSIGIGYGFVESNYGLSLGFSYDLFLGSFTFVGIQACLVAPVATQQNRTPIGFVGLTIGLSLGQ